MKLRELGKDVLPQSLTFRSHQPFIIDVFQPLRNMFCLWLDRLVQIQSCTEASREFHAGLLDGTEQSSVGSARLEPRTVSQPQATSSRTAS